MEMSKNTNIGLKCSYCSLSIEDDNYLHCLQCNRDVHVKCLRHASTPGDLLGDVFFDFTCAKCMQLQYEGPTTSSAVPVVQAREKFARQRMPWLMTITLTLYNLSIKSKGLSHHGYFHWRTHIVSFINKNWDYLFESTSRRRKKWLGSVSGALSHNSPDFFLSGQEVFNETGWWKLTHSNCTPKEIFRMYEQLCQKRQQMRSDRRIMEDNADANLLTAVVIESKRLRRNESEENLVETDSCSRTIPYMGRKPKVAKQLNIMDVESSKQLPNQSPLSQADASFNTVQSSLMDFLAESLASEDLNMFNNLPNIAPEPLVGGKNDFLLDLPHNGNNDSFFNIPELKEEPHGKAEYNQHAVAAATQSSTKIQEKFRRGEKQLDALLSEAEEGENEDNLNSNNNDNDEEEEDADEDDFQPRIIQVTNFQQYDNAGEAVAAAKLTVKTEILSEDEAELLQHSNLSHEDDDADEESLPPCKPSLFSKQPRRQLPWLVPERVVDDVAMEHEKNDECNNLEMMSEYEEKQLLLKLKQVIEIESRNNMPIPSYIRLFYRKLCIREWKREHSRPVFNLDDYLNDKQPAKSLQNNNKAKIIDRYQILSSSNPDQRKSFYARIAGSFHYELFESPYTQRLLHPFIYRNKECFPSWLKLMCEMQYAVSGVVPKRSPIDFCYVRPNHIAAVNALLRSLFWPGIDMTECLSYPDFSVVALYKKLVIGCGFLVPDVGFNEAYISFMAVRPGWQRCGIATFMLYHLIQTCMSKDITLHVSATNPAVVLYQKFGFKIEEIILNFYDKYLPHDSKHSRNAFFLRLLR